MGLLPLTYRRPEYVDKHEFRRSESGAESDEGRSVSLESGRSGTSSGIPNALTFDKIMNGGTCPVSLGKHYSHAFSLADHVHSPAPSEIS